MAEYIDREIAIDEFDRRGIYGTEVFDEIPIADVAEVKHGKWLANMEEITTLAGITKDFVVGYKCSLCGRTEISKEPYCNCGAKMDLGDEEE